MLQLLNQTVATIRNQGRFITAGAWLVALRLEFLLRLEESLLFAHLGRGLRPFRAQKQVALVCGLRELVVAGLVAGVAKVEERGSSHFV